MRKYYKVIRYSLIITALVGCIAVPLYSYAIDYTSSNDKPEQNTPYTSGEMVDKTIKLGGGLKKTVRVPKTVGEPAPANETGAPTDTAAAAAGTTDAGTASASQYMNEEEEREECTPADRLRIGDMDKTLKKYASLTESAYNAAKSLDKGGLENAAKSDIADAQRSFFKANGLLDKNFMKDFNLYKKCDTLPPESDFLPLPRSALELFE